MRKRTSIIGALLIGMLVILAFFIAVVLALWFSQYFQMQGEISGRSSLMHFFLNISPFELFGIFFIGAIMASVVVRYIASNIKANFDKFNQFFYDAMQDGKMIDEENLNFKEFTTLARSVNRITQKAHEAKKRLEFNEKYLQTVLDAQKNIVIVRSRGRMEKANQAFLTL